jgi:FtsP/CotA-like multicopper oxidase with cupredoxin domain
MRRWRTVTAILTVGTAFAATACVSTAAGESGGAGEAAAAAPAPVEVMLSDFKIEPATIEVPSGTPLAFSIMNHGATPHTFGVVVNGSTVESDQIAGGATGTLSVPALEAGSYQALCTVPGHADLGMRATVVAATDVGTAAVEAAPPSAEAATGATGSADMSAEEMASMHEQGVGDFLAGDQTDTVGGTLLKPKIEHGVKRYYMTIEQVDWEVSEGVTKPAMAFNGIVPGPEVRVQQGDRVQFVFQNEMDQPTTVHFHGLTVPNSEDGVPYVTQEPIMPGQYWTYEFTIEDPPGMYVYHSHFNSTEQVGKGLYGALIVEPKHGDWTPYYGHQPDEEYSMFLGDGPLDYVINGKSFPATAPLAASKGDWVLLHMANDGSLLHPMHLHGYHFMVVGEDGFPLAARNRYMADTLVVAPGSRYDILVHATEPGAWAFHCHILPHVEGPQGMYGMVTALVVS